MEEATVSLHIHSERNRVLHKTGISHCFMHNIVKGTAWCSAHGWLERICAHVLWCLHCTHTYMAKEAVQFQDKYYNILYIILHRKAWCKYHVLENTMQYLMTSDSLSDQNKTEPGCAQTWRRYLWLFTYTERSAVVVHKHGEGCHGFPHIWLRPP